MLLFQLPPCKVTEEELLGICDKKWCQNVWITGRLTTFYCNSAVKDWEYGVLSVTKYVERFERIRTGFSALQWTPSFSTLCVSHYSGLSIKNLSPTILQTSRLFQSIQKPYVPIMYILMARRLGDRGSIAGRGRKSLLESVQTSSRFNQFLFSRCGSLIALGWSVWRVKLTNHHIYCRC